MYRLMAEDYSRVLLKEWLLLNLFVQIHFSEY